MVHDDALPRDELDFPVSGNGISRFYEIGAVLCTQGGRQVIARASHSLHDKF